MLTLNIHTSTESQLFPYEASPQEPQASIRGATPLAHSCCQAQSSVILANQTWVVLKKGGRDYTLNFYQEQKLARN